LGVIVSICCFQASVLSTVILKNFTKFVCNIQELMTDSKHLKDQQDIADTFNNYFSSIFDIISKNNVNNITNNEKIPTFHYYLEQNYVHPPSSLVIKTFSTKEITSITKALKT
jgi:hypothetical protein